MALQTRLINLLFSRNKKARRESWFANYIESQDTQPLLPYPQSKWSIDQLTRILCLLLIGFLMGNVFGTFLSSIRKYVTWDGIILFFLLSVIEILNYTIYHNNNRAFLGGFIHAKIINKSFWKWFHFLKIGLMVGLFVDAFKVGS